MNEDQTYHGKYKGVVIENEDSSKRGRVRVRVANILDGPGSGWALPCVPYAGDGVGLFLIPPKGASVWVEFEEGKLDRPIWSGCFWEENQQAPESKPDCKILKTDKATITISDEQGSSGITIETSDRLKIVMDSNGIEINNGKDATIKLSGGSVKVNNDALEVT